MIGKYLIVGHPVTTGFLLFYTYEKLSVRRLPKLAK